ncbi:Na/Pi cotransporter family protein [Brucellaceae bacterium C25G]
MSDMSPLLFLLHIGGGAALLLWSVRLVRTAVERGWSVSLRRLLRKGDGNKLFAAATGTVSAVLLQSSTAVALMVASFVSAASLSAPAGLAILLGADLGSAIVAKILMTRADWLIPVLLIAGVAFFLKGRQRTIKMTGRILIGLALVFISLTLLREATEPLRHSPGLVTAMGYLGKDLITAFAIGAVLAWMMYSSVAAILLFVTLCTQGVLPAEAGMAMVLGANLGGGFIAYMLTLNAEVPARRIVIANLILRGGGAFIALMLLSNGIIETQYLGQNASLQVINLHLAFNFVLTLVALPFTAFAVKIVSLWIQPVSNAATIARLTALDGAALTQPERALSCATRELLVMGEIAESMLRSIMPLYTKWDDATAQAILAKETEVSRMHQAIKLYLARIQRSATDEEINRRIIEIAEMAVNINGAASTVAESMLALARRLDQEGTRFSQTGWQEIADFHDRIMANSQSALNVLMMPDPAAAKALVQEKDIVREVEQKLQRSHLDRLSMGMVESIETSSIHQETLRALKQINGLFIMVAYPILASNGTLLSSRLNHG